MKFDPQNYNLPGKTKLHYIGEKHVGIVKLIKSRIIQKDAAKIVEMSRQIKSIEPTMNVSLICTSNICSKSKALFQSEGISVIIEDLQANFID